MYKIYNEQQVPIIKCLIIKIIFISLVNILPPYTLHYHVELLANNFYFNDSEMKKLLIILMLMTNQIQANTEHQALQVAYLAGGCYWGLEELIRKIPGVLYTKVGFSGGHIKNVSYKEVTRGDTGHAESIEIKFNSKELSFENLLFNFFKMHNPTTINQQGNDRGPQYRSSIFYINEEQKSISLRTIDTVNKSKKWEDPVITEVIAFSDFYAAEESHQKYILKNPDGYSCHFVRKFDFTK